MSTRTGIEWTDATWNPVRGCEKVSPGCAHCYAETFAERFRGVPGHPYEQGFDLRLVPEKLTEPVKWKPKRIFVNSMSDLFQDGVPDGFINLVYETMEQLAPQHIYQVLTKRAERMRDYLNWRYGEHRITSRHIWHGVSVENQHFADERIPLLLQARSAIRFISAEPLLGPVKLDHMDVERVAGDAGYYFINALTGQNRDMGRPCRDVPKLDWVIVGGESGPGARPLELAWARAIVQQCKAAGVPCFVKQLGAYPIDDQQDELLGYVDLRNPKGGDPTEWPTDLRVREFPHS